MEIAILVFFLAIFGGVLFLLALVWFIFRRLRKSRPAGRNFSDNRAHYVSGHDPEHENFTDPADDPAAIYAGSSLFSNQNSENPVLTETARDGLNQTDHAYSHESHGAFAAPAENSYPEISYSSYDSGSGSDAGSSSDSGSGSSDSGSSSSD